MKLSGDNHSVSGYRYAVRDQFQMSKGRAASDTSIIKSEHMHESGEKSPGSGIVLFFS